LYHLAGKWATLSTCSRIPTTTRHLNRISIEFERVGPTDPDAVALAKEMTDAGSRAYADRGLIRAESLADLLSPDDRLLLGRLDGRPVAIGAVRRMEPGIGEIKRMYVVPEHQGQGVGRMLLKALEAEARNMGFERLRLDTGNRQTAAIALYRSAGYRPIDPYNDTADLWFERDLADNVD
jgi:GNAT superfamily N-acetyltransferase